MKKLNDYIIEKQQINEAGIADTLFGKIVMKLLDTGIDWIGKGVGWIANSLKDAVKEGWQTVRAAGNKTFDAFVHKHKIEYKKMPNSEAELAAFLNNIIEKDNRNYDQKFDIFEDWGKEYNDYNTAITYICKMQLTYAGKKDISVDDLKTYIKDLQDFYKRYGNKLNKSARTLINGTVDKLNERIKEIENK